MKKLFTLLLLLWSLQTIAQVHVRGYYRKDGTYVQPHVRSSPDGNPYNNYSYPGNYNPYTGVTAGGSSEAYLRNYYKVYPTYSAFNYHNVSTCYNTNFKGIQPFRNYEVRDSNGNLAGYIVHWKLVDFKLYDATNTLIGYVQTRRKAKRYSVYDVNGDLIRKI